ncbi:hypothetical protein H6P81_003032 [Aristolochia fimbriata]|uniref:Uncharacterized protein n=1 Tax=Aristolochia fimbriata TaxID=158543 RepID=A0AAV7FD46_ARIFI|nr:hypothetical protein H6P81_003032 [Aristolochia fimbriata]
MEHRQLLALLIIFMGFSHLVSVRAVPASRSFVLLGNRDPLGEILDQMSTEEAMLLEEDFVRGRMDIESTDYPGSGANNRHDPKTPGRN